MYANSLSSSISSSDIKYELIGKEIKYQGYGDTPNCAKSGLVGRRLPPISVIFYNGTQYTTIDTCWGEGEQANYWDVHEQSMKKVTVMSPGQSCLDGFDTYHCSNFGAETEDDEYVLKHA